MQLKKKKSEELAIPGYTFLGKGTVIKGTLTSDDGLRIEGSVIGDINSTSKVVIAASGMLEGDLSCQVADISGILHGDINSKGDTLVRSTSQINGNIQAISVEVEPGASIRGQLMTGSTIEENKQKEEIITEES